MFTWREAHDDTKTRPKSIHVYSAGLYINIFSLSLSHHYEQLFSNEIRIKKNQWTLGGLAVCAFGIFWKLRV